MLKLEELYFTDFHCNEFPFKFFQTVKEKMPNLRLLNIKDLRGDFQDEKSLVQYLETLEKAIKHFLVVDNLTFYVNITKLHIEKYLNFFVNILLKEGQFLRITTNGLQFCILRKSENDIEIRPE